MSEATVLVADACLKIRRTFPASAERLFGCFTEPAHLLRWWGPQGTTCPNAEVDLREGGNYRLEILAPSGALSVVSGEYLEIEPPNRLVFTWRWDDTPEEQTRVTLEFRALAADRVELSLTHERFPDDARADLHGEGWSSSLECLLVLLDADDATTGGERS